MLQSLPSPTKNSLHSLKMRTPRLLFVLWLATLILGCAEPQSTFPWKPIELTFNGEQYLENPYTDVNFYAQFINEHGDTLLRPGFWNGNKEWKIRFNPLGAIGSWSYTTYSEPVIDGLHGQQGQLKVVAPQLETYTKMIPLKMSPGKRSVIDHSGKSKFLVADTPWALPYRATTEQVKNYAQFRQNQGFNAALLMTLQPDTAAEGPNKRNTIKGFRRGFLDLYKGHINQMDPNYFKELDTLMSTLLNHDIMPIYQPLFHGFGWKGLGALGKTVEAKEYVRYCNYLLARYGAYPAIWLVGADSDGNDPGVADAGKHLEEWDAYRQPTGIHYNPFDTITPAWAIDFPEIGGGHFNKTHQSANWLDFQWCQTGHKGIHNYSKVAKMWHNHPLKGVANGEPTYEGATNGSLANGPWQTEEAWGQLLNGGTMGIFYGAVGLFQWKITADETGWKPWLNQPLNWEQALHLDGANYVGHFSKFFEGLNSSDMELIKSSNGKNSIAAQDGSFYFLSVDSNESYAIPKKYEKHDVLWFLPQEGSFQKAVKHENVIQNKNDFFKVLLVVLREK